MEDYQENPHLQDLETVFVNLATLDAWLSLYVKAGRISLSNNIYAFDGLLSNSFGIGIYEDDDTKKREPVLMVNNEITDWFAGIPWAKAVVRNETDRLCLVMDPLDFESDEPMQQFAIALKILNKRLDVFRKFFTGKPSARLKIFGFDMDEDGIYADDEPAGSVKIDILEKDAPILDKVQTHKAEAKQKAKETKKATKKRTKIKM